MRRTGAAHVAPGMRGSARDDRPAKSFWDAKVIGSAIDDIARMRLSDHSLSDPAVRPNATE